MSTSKCSNTHINFPLKFNLLKAWFSRCAQSDMNTYIDVHLCYNMAGLKSSAHFSFNTCNKESACPGFEKLAFLIELI